MSAHQPPWFVIANGRRMRIAVRGELPGSYQTLWRAGAAVPGNGSEQMRTSPLNGRRQIKHAGLTEWPGSFQRWDAPGFCWRMAKVLNESCARHEFDELVLIAPERMLRTIHEGLDVAVIRCIIGEVPKDLTRVPDPDVARHLAAAMSCGASVERRQVSAGPRR